MKKNLIIVSVLMLGAFAAQAQTSGTAKTTTAKTTTAKTQATKASVSENMKGFLALFNGDYKMVQEALTKYEKQGLDRHDMDMYNLIQPKVMSTEIKDKTEKYLIEVKSGVTTRKFEISWEDGKISEVKDLGLK